MQSSYVVQRRITCAYTYTHIKHKPYIGIGTYMNRFNITGMTKGEQETQTSID